MDQLMKARKTINEVDQAMAELFEKRMKAVKAVIEYKIQQGLPILDTVREKEVIEINSAHIQDAELKEYYREYIVALMKISKDYQAAIQKEIKQQ